MIKLIPNAVDTTSQTFVVVITEKLCKPFCENSSIQPVVDVNFSVESTKFVDTVSYAKIKAQGVVTYVSKDGCQCSPSTKIFTEYFTVGFLNQTEAVTPDIVEFKGYVEPAYVNCFGVACGIEVTNTLALKIPA